MEILPLSIGPIEILCKAVSFPKIFYKNLKPFISSHASGIPAIITFIDGHVNTEGHVSVERTLTEFTCAREDFTATIREQPLEIAVHITRDYLSFNSCLRVLMSFILLRHTAFLVHASGLVFDNEAHVFIGKAGAGKSTMIKNNTHLMSMGDEMIGIIKKNSGYAAFSTPFGGELSSPRYNCTMPLAAVYWLEKGQTVKLQGLPQSIAFEHILQCIINFSADKNNVDTIVSLTNALVNDVVFYKLITKKTTLFEEVLNYKRKVQEKNVCVM